MDQEEPAEPRKAACQELEGGIFLLCYFQLQHGAQQTAGSLKIGVGERGVGIKHLNVANLTRFNGRRETTKCYIPERFMKISS